MSNIKSNIFDNSFDSYGKAMDAVLKNRNLSKKWLAIEVREEPVKLESLQSQISRWIKGEPVGDDYRDKINKALDLTIKQNSNGRWTIQEGYRSQKSLLDVALVQEKVSHYRVKERKLDDLPEILRLKNELEGWIDELLKKESD